MLFHGLGLRAQGVWLRVERLRVEGRVLGVKS